MQDLARKRKKLQNLFRSHPMWWQDRAILCKILNDVAIFGSSIFCGILTRTLTRPQHTEPVRLSTRSDFLTWEQVDTVGTPWEEDIFVSLLQQLGHQQAQQHYNTEAAFNRKSSIKHRRVNRKQTWNYRIHCTQHMEAVVPVADYATTRLNTISNSSHWWKVVCGNSYPVYE